MASGIVYNGNTNTSGTAPSDSSAYNQGAPVTVLGNTGSLAKVGSTYNGWNTDPDGLGDQYDGGDIFNIGGFNVDLYAQWVINSYTVSFNANGGSKVTPSQTAEYGATIILNTSSNIRVGYTWSGWNTEADGSGTAYAQTAEYTIGLGDQILYAQWTPLTFYVLFDGNTGSGSMANQEMIFDSTANLSVNTFAKADHIFGGWNTTADGSGVAYANQASFTMTNAADVTLYAQWTLIPVGTFRVTYEGNTNTSGNVPSDVNFYPENGQVTVFGNTGSLAKSGYNFGDWNTEADGSGTARAANSTFNITSNTSLYARWLLINYTISYTLNGGINNPANPSTYSVESSTINLNNPTRVGYTFAGWSIPSIAAGSTGNVTTVASWSVIPPIEYNVTYLGNTNTSGNPPSDSGTYQTGAMVTVLGNTGNMIKTGFTFGGWNTAANGSGDQYAAGSNLTMGSSNVQLYAQWTVIQHTLTYTAGPGITLTGNANQTVNQGANGSQVTASAGLGFMFTTWSDGVLTPSRTELNVQANISVTAVAVAVIGVAGGTRESADTLSRIEIPANALDADTEIAVELVADPMTDIFILSNTYEFKPHDLIFNIPSKAVFKRPTGTPVNAKIYWSTGSGSVFEKLATVYNSLLNVFEANVSHFSTGFLGEDDTTHTVTVTSSGNGAVIPNTTQTIETGGFIAITANPAVGFRFVRWVSLELSAYINDVNSAQTTIDGIDISGSVIAVFEQATPTSHDITIQTSGSGTVTPSGVVSVAEGSILNISAVPGAGQRFVRWVVIQ